MPRSAVCRGMSQRGLSPEACSPAEFYAVSCWLGVGYETLVRHALHSLEIVTPRRAAELLRYSPKSTRAELLGREEVSHLIPVDQCWSDRPVDVAVADLVIAPAVVEAEGDCVVRVQGLGQAALFRGDRPGIGRLTDQASHWSTYIRVSRSGYVGLAKYRHFEDRRDG